MLLDVQSVKFEY